MGLYTRHASNVNAKIEPVSAMAMRLIEKPNQEKSTTQNLVISVSSSKLPTWFFGDDTSNHGPRWQKCACVAVVFYCDDRSKNLSRGHA